MNYYHWQQNRIKVGTAPYTRSSPNLLELLAYLVRTFGGQSVGIYGVRPIRESQTIISTHSWGAALDWRYRNVGANHRNVADVDAVISWMIANAEILGVQMIIVEETGDVWRVDRGWKRGSVKAGGPGSAWLHIETNPDHWSDARAIGIRSSSDPHPMPTLPTNPPLGGQSMITVTLSTLSMRKPGDPPLLELDVRRAQGLLIANGLELDVDGGYGPITQSAVRVFQQRRALTVDGVIGPQTWRALLDPDA